MIRTVKVNWHPLERRPLVKNPSKGRGVVHAFIQARLSSKRFPRKIYEDLNGAPLLYHVVSQALSCKLIDRVVVCSPHELPDVPDNVDQFIYGGEESDVLGRYVACFNEFPCEYIVRLTADCPLLDPYLIDFIIENAFGSDYCSNVMKLTFPDGVDTEVLSASCLKAIDKFSAGREHVTTILRESEVWQRFFEIVSVESPKDYSKMKISVDTKTDLENVRKIERKLKWSKQLV